MHKERRKRESRSRYWERMLREDVHKSRRRIVPVHPDQINLLGDLVAHRAKKDDNKSTCMNCREAVTLLGREGFKLAYTEETVRIGHTTKTVYWCQPCTEAWEDSTPSIQALQRSMLTSA